MVDKNKKKSHVYKWKPLYWGQDLTFMDYLASSEAVQAIGTHKKPDLDALSADKPPHNVTMHGTPFHGLLERHAFEHAITSQAYGDRNIRPDMLKTLAPVVAAVRAAEGGVNYPERGWVGGEGGAARPGLLTGEKTIGRTKDIPWKPKRSNHPQAKDTWLTTGAGAYYRKQYGSTAAGAQKHWDRYHFSIPQPAKYTKEMGYDYLHSWAERRTPTGGKATDDPLGKNETFLPFARAALKGIKDQQKVYDEQKKKLKNVGRTWGVQKFMERETRYYGG